MQIQTFPMERLTPEHQEAWHAVQTSRACFDSPYFRPEFTRLVAQVRPCVEVAVLSDAGEYVGFFPYERKTATTAQPVGNVLCDFHGVIAKAGTKWTAGELLEACGLTAWDFHHLVPEDHQFEEGYWQESEALSMDLSQGFEAYKLERRQAGSQRIKHIAKRKRKLERELGPVTVDTDCRDEQVFQKLLGWKSCQYKRGGVMDLLQVPWVVNLLRSIWQQTSPTFRGRLFALYVGGELLAVELSMQSGPVLHSWFPVYHCQYAKYGVGHVLRQEMAMAAESLDIQRIDLGKDEEQFKRSLASLSTPIASGSFDLNPVRSTVRKRCSQTSSWLKATRLGQIAREPYRSARRLFRNTSAKLRPAGTPALQENWTAISRMFNE